MDKVASPNQSNQCSVDGRRSQSFQDMRETNRKELERRSSLSAINDEIGETGRGNGINKSRIMIICSG